MISIRRETPELHNRKRYVHVRLTRIFRRETREWQKEKYLMEFYSFSTVDHNKKTKNVVWKTD